MCYKFAGEVKKPIHHVINWKRLGTLCDLPLNQKFRYLAEAPEGSFVCEECQAVLDSMDEQQRKQLEDSIPTGERPKGWEKEVECYCCETKRIINSKDVFKTSSTIDGKFVLHLTVKCPVCKTLTNLEKKSVPGHIEDQAPFQNKWESIHDNKSNLGSNR